MSNTTGCEYPSAKTTCLPLDLSSVSHPYDIELALEAFGHTGHRVRHEAPRQTMELAELGIVGRSLRMKVSVLQLEADAGGHGLAKRCLWAPEPQQPLSWTFTVTPLGMVMTFLPIRDISSALSVDRYHTLQSSSPPTPAFTASRPVITPRDVVRMLVPNPARTSGTSCVQSRLGGLDD